MLGTLPIPAECFLRTVDWISIRAIRAGAHSQTLVSIIVTVLKLGFAFIRGKAETIMIVNTLEISYIGVFLLVPFRWINRTRAPSQCQVLEAFGMLSIA